MLRTILGNIAYKKKVSLIYLNVQYFMKIRTLFPMVFKIKSCYTERKRKNRVASWLQIELRLLNQKV